MTLLLSVAWLFRVTLYQPGEPWTQTATVPGIPGVVVAIVVAAFFLVATVLTVWPQQQEAKGEFHGEESGSWKQ